MVKQVVSLLVVLMAIGSSKIAFAEESAEETCKRIAAEDQIPADERADFIAQCVEDMKASSEKKD